MSHPPDVQKSAPDPRSVPFFPPIHFCLFFPFFEVILNPPHPLFTSPCTLSPTPQFLNPPRLPVNTWTPLLCALNSCLFGALSNFCSVLKSPPRSQPHSSLGNVDLFLTSSSRSEASGDHQPRLCQKNVWEWSTWEREGASNCFSFLFFFWN